ncbi:NAD(P)/FAD-dependent oxidoreductase [Synechococcus sp. MIT S9504]|uniref:NAD(P)/FAD-dependent oxidoreductase n=1 Tax=Synechococcus sp. MIT S9504 TaxID=1801628 RepID=UPI0007BB2F5A|nr:FAD-dependent oxidoreductase [Synechococcus sp. MIT S9504]KZR86865.1 FAD dependent oxidoreductase [Synechococcus sp. MIT S9504]
MLRLSELRLGLDHSEDDLEQAVLRCLRVPREQLISCQLVKQSIDARRRDRIRIIYSVDVQVRGEKALLRRRSADRRIRRSPDESYRFVARAPSDLVDASWQRPVVIGAGPCGYFAALLLAQMGLRPLLLERGQAVKQRSRDTFGFWRRQSTFKPESNVQFGEGGAGTFSDGKLYSQVSDPVHYGRKVLEELVKCGANRDILTRHRPHIGTFKLATVVRGLRAQIEALGGEVRFGSRVEQLLLEPASSKQAKPMRIIGLQLADGSRLDCSQVVLAPGHSARDTFAMLDRTGVALERKPFAIGLRIEHPQSLIDNARWGDAAGHPLLGAAEYKLVHHAANGRCVYSFCMCPGGFVVGATSEPGRVVTNGMSQHSRNERNANSGLVIPVSDADLEAHQRWPGDPLAGLVFQRELESLAFQLGGQDYSAPVQRQEDFVAGRPSTCLGSVSPSYQPGVQPSDLAELLPEPMVEALREALTAFSQKICGYDHPDAVLTGVETRTSSPLRIPRDDRLESINVIGLTPAGEGAGYAGGILSAAIDGIRAAEAVALRLLPQTSN